MQNTLFLADSYHTPEDTPRLLSDKIMLGSRIPFLMKYIAKIIKSRKKALLGKYDTKAWAESSLEILRLIEACSGRFHISGLENLYDCKNPLVFAANHMSTLETMVLPALIASHMEVVFIVKKSLVEHPLFGPIMRARNPIVVGRTNSREDLKTVMSKGRELLDNGTSIIVFPQSTRYEIFSAEDFNSIGVKLAARAKAKVVPIALRTDFWGNGKYIKELGPLHRQKPIYFTFGKALDVDGPGKDTNQAIINFIVSHLDSWKQMDNTQIVRG